jgi:hypothetical protein
VVLLDTTEDPLVPRRHPTLRILQSFSTLSFTHVKDLFGEVLVAVRDLELAGFSSTEVHPLFATVVGRRTSVLGPLQE